MTVILVEGESDRIALETLGARFGMRMPDIRVAGGAHGMRRLAATLPSERILGLVDGAERRVVDSVVDELFVCEPDLEGELIRALGIAGVEGVFAAQGELESFRRLQRQPDQRDRDEAQQITRFIGGRSGNKARYARLLTEALPLGDVPAPLAALVDAARR